MARHSSHAIYYAYMYKVYHICRHINGVNDESISEKIKIYAPQSLRSFQIESDMKLSEKLWTTPWIVNESQLH